MAPKWPQVGLKMSITMLSHISLKDEDDENVKNLKQSYIFEHVLHSHNPCQQPYHIPCHADYHAIYHAIYHTVSYSRTTSLILIALIVLEDLSVVTRY